MFASAVRCRAAGRSWRPAVAGSRARFGFSLVEMAVVLGIVGVLVGIAFSYFQQSRGEAEDVLAQQIARSTVSALEASYHNRGMWVSSLPELSAMMPDTTFVAGATAAPFDVSVAAGGTSAAVAVQSDSGSCFVIKITDQVTSVVEATDVYTIAPQSPCSGAAAMLTAANVDKW